jgi:DNA-binding response OmpR family regulator
MRVLLVDDEEELVSALAERLSFRGIEATWATSGQKALELASRTCFELAVLDVKMPGMGGLELKRRLVEICPDLKILFLTGHGSEDDFRRGSAESGREFYLVKPVAIEDLIKKMQEAVAR